jgi:hypothetical protein
VRVRVTGMVPPGKRSAALRIMGLTAARDFAVSHSRVSRSNGTI